MASFAQIKEIRSFLVNNLLPLDQYPPLDEHILEISL
jgi:hypothetical protein